ncbi:MAG: M20/M25/M40 family metallo-hydrolase [Phenylobacterium sp.]
MNRLGALCLTLVAGLGLAIFLGQPPSPRPADAPTEAFSATRALADVGVIARSPHPVGSPENAEVRNYIVLRMQALGLSPEVRPDFSFRRLDRIEQPVFLGGRVENIIGVLPGKDRSAPALALVAHYDSVPNSPGAADDAAGVATVLEVARMLRTGPVPSRDVIFLLTDGEEAGLLGAQAFFERDPLARRIGFLINMEARGGGGRVQMFQTGKHNSGTIRLLQEAAQSPTSSSLAVLLYSAMPNDTDFTVSRAAGVAGMNFAFIGRQFDYHAASSTPANLDPGSLQHMGNQVSAVALTLARSAALPSQGPDKVFSHVAGDLLIAYPAALGWLILAVVGGLLALAVRNARRLGALDAPGVVRGVGAGVYLLLLTSALLHLARRIAASGDGFLEQRGLLARAGVWEIALLLIGLGVLLLTPYLAARGRGRLQACALALVAGAAALPFGWDLAAVALGIAAGVTGVMTFGPPVRVAPAWTGVLLTALVTATVLQVIAPTAAFLVAWPLLAACLLALLTSLGASGARWRLPLAGFAMGAPVTAWLLGYAHGVFLGLDLPALLAVFAWLSALTLWPLLHGDAGEARLDRRVPIVTAGAVAAGLALAAFLRLAPPWSERLPEVTVVQHLQDENTGEAFLVSPEPHLSRWSRRVLAREGGRPSPARDQLVTRGPYWSAPARPIALKGVETSLEGLPDGRKRLVIRAPSDARGLSLDLRSNTLATGATVNGQPASLLAAPGVWNRIRLEAPPQETVIEFRPAGPGSLEARTLTRLSGWPAGVAALPPRRPSERPFLNSDTALVKAERTFNW